MRYPGHQAAEERLQKALEPLTITAAQKAELLAAIVSLTETISEETAEERVGRHYRNDHRYLHR